MPNLASQSRVAFASIASKTGCKSPGELEPVFDAMLANATRLCEAKFGTLYLYDGDTYRAASMYNAPPAFAEYLRRGPIRPGPGTGLSGLLKRSSLFTSPTLPQSKRISRPILYLWPLLKQPVTELCSSSQCSKKGS